MFSVLDIKVTWDMTAYDIKNYFRSLGIVGYINLTDDELRRFREMAKKQGMKVRE